MTCWSLSYNESTPAPATPRRMLAPAPLKSDLAPSLAIILKKIRLMVYSINKNAYLRTGIDHGLVVNL